MQRQQYYADLRERARKADYGSHKDVENLANKRLLDKKREEWKRERDLVEMN